jgi:hypothetical protein
MNERMKSWISRRRFLQALGVWGGGACPIYRLLAERESAGVDLVETIEREVVWNGRAGGTTWFHPRACMVPGDGGPLGFMTLQSITGSDVFGPVHWSVTKDMGRSWSMPVEIAALGRHPSREGLSEGMCDVVPEYHPRTDTVLAIGHNVYYDRDGRLARPQLERYPVYVVRNRDGRFSSPKKLAWDDPRGTAIYTCGCAQRVTLSDGRILIPFSFGAKGETARSVCSVLCGYDGETVRIERCGNALSNGINRGLLEPSLAEFGGCFFMTIRAEDDRGYVTTSRDGLNWEEQKAWCWDDGEPLTMSTTQQRWLPHSDALYLVYTRKADKNINVFRWRAPLYLARVDTERLCLMKATERVVFPLVGDGVHDAGHVARMGNFHTVAAAPEESWVTVGECLPNDGWRGDLLQARILWVRPERNH